VGFLREADAGVAVKELCRKHGFSEGSYYRWRSKFGGMSVSDAKREVHDRAIPDHGRPGATDLVAVT
jgi:transposase-like protein